MMQKNTLIPLIFLAAASLSNGAVTVTDLGSGLYRATVDIQVEVIDTSSVGHVITVEDFYANPSPSDGGVPSPGATLSMSVNGGTASLLTLWTNSGIYGPGWGFWDANDFAISWNFNTTPSYDLGDTLRISGEFDFTHSGALTFIPTSGLDVYLSSNSSGNTIALGTGVTSSFADGDLSAVPEPSGVLTLGCLLGGGLMLRTRRKTA